MDAKTIFLNSLYDEQMGFFCAHEYSENLEEMLQDELNVKHFNLFKEWKESEIKAPISDYNVAHDILTNKLDLIESILERITARLEALEEKITPANTPIADVVAPVYEQITGIEKVLSEIITRFDATEEKTNKEVDRTSDVVEPIVNRIDGMEKVLEKIMNRLEQTEKDTNKPVNETVLPTRQEEPEKPKKENQQLMNASISLASVEITRNYSEGNVHFKKGEIYGLTEHAMDFIVFDHQLINIINISTGKSIRNVPYNHCKHLYIPGTFKPLMVDVMMQS